MKAKYCLFTFSSTHHALRAETMLKEAKIEVDVVPIPREITAECGLGMQIALEEKEKAEEIFLQEKIKVAGIYNWDEEGKIIFLKSLLED